MLTRYEVIETMVYEVWAVDAEAAVDTIANDANRDARGPACIERIAAAVTDENGKPLTRED